MPPLPLRSRPALLSHLDNLSGPASHRVGCAGGSNTRVASNRIGLRLNPVIKTEGEKP